jgi:hypothetical protein
VRADIHRLGMDKGGKLSRVHSPSIPNRLGWLQIVLDRRAFISQNIKRLVDVQNMIANFTVIRVKHVGASTVVIFILLSASYFYIFEITL